MPAMRTTTAPIPNPNPNASYETTTALPIEYGILHVCSVLTGCIFFQEYWAMDARQIAFAFIGLIIVM